MKCTLDVDRKTAYFNTLKYFLITIFSLTFAFPYAFLKYHSWLIGNTKLNGKNLVFDGRTKSLYYIYFSGIILGVVIYFLYIGLYTGLLYLLLENKVDINYTLMNSWSVKIVSLLPSALVALLITSRFYKYRSTHTHFSDYDNTESGIRLEVFNILFSSIVFKIIVLVTNVVGYPFALNIRERFYIGRRFIDENDLIFVGTIRRIVFIWVTGIILSIITIFMYIPYFFFRLNRYIIVNTALKNEIIDASGN